MKKLISANLVMMFVLFSCKHEPLVDTPNTTDPPIVDSTGCDPNTVYFVNDVLPIFSSSCAMSGCHDAGTSEDGVVLNNYQNIIITGEVEAGDPSESKVFKVITENDPSDIMPPPSSGITLSNAQIQTIYDWIAAGAINNECIESSCDTTNVSFSADIFPVVQSYCLGCHSGSSPQGNVLLSDYNNIKARVDDGRFLGSVDHQAGYAAMPQGQAKLNDCTISQIKKWINDGAPNN